jgi:phage gp36-like protein
MYSSITRIKSKLTEQTLIQLTDDEGLGQANDARITAALEKGSSVIDLFCGVKYSVPFASPWPAVIDDLADDLAEYELYARKVQEFPPAVKERRDNAARFLTDISKGTASLGIDPAPAAPTAGASETNVETNNRVFTRDKLKGF